QCYGELRGCFHGNLTVTLGSAVQWREVRGCVREESCPQEAHGDEAVRLTGSCCSGDLCNQHLLSDNTFFAPHWPRLQLLPHGQQGPGKMADGVNA
ncbi:LYPD3 protein, partial [Bucco capensis]|nr:LYPD3 protein [Bucco capensis]